MLNHPHRPVPPTAPHTLPLAFPRAVSGPSCLPASSCAAAPCRCWGVRGRAPPLRGGCGGTPPQVSSSRPSLTGRRKKSTIGLHLNNLTINPLPAERLPLARRPSRRTVVGPPAPRVGGLSPHRGGRGVAELRYKAWGETRYTYGTTPTTYRFTGQREDATIGLYPSLRSGQAFTTPATTTRRWGGSCSPTRSCRSRATRRR